MDKEKMLYKNTGIIAIGKLSSKLFTFLLLPLYTSALLPEDYGTVDVLQTVISLLLYMLTLQVESGVFRFIIEHRDNREKQRYYITGGILLLMLNSVIFTGFILTFNLFISITHLLLFILTLWANAFSSIMMNIARGMGHNLLYSISNTCVTLVSLVVNIVLILGLKLGAESILIALIISNFTGGLIVYFREKIWSIFSFTSFRVAELKEMLTYSIPLVPNAVSWWIANASDRMLILIFLGSARNGIYAAANKLPTIYTTIFSVFNLAWSESVALCVNDPDKDEYINRMMNRCLRLFSFLAAGIICCMSLTFDLLIGDNYGDAYAHIFILTVAAFINSLCALYGGIFFGFKDTKFVGISTVIGAIVNFVFNLVAIKTIGLYAASISTLISYIVILLVRLKAVKKYITITWQVGLSIQLLSVFIIAGIGYFLHSYLINLCILIGIMIWGFLINKELITGFIIQRKRELCITDTEGR